MDKQTTDQIKRLQRQIEKQVREIEKLRRQLCRVKVLSKEVWTTATRS
jgi:hypothetical protein